MTRNIALLLILTLGSLAACTPADEQYCRNLGVAGTTEYSNCMNYYHTQENAFNADRAFCDSEADTVYPRTLYDTGRQEPIFYGGGAWGGPGPWGRPWGPWSGGYSGISTAYIPPDAAHNAQVDALRNRIAGPCMDARGWNSPDSWQAGTHLVRKKAVRPQAKPASPASLPWIP